MTRDLLSMPSSKDSFSDKVGLFGVLGGVSNTGETLSTVNQKRKYISIWFYGF